MFGTLTTTAGPYFLAIVKNGAVHTEGGFFSRFGSEALMMVCDDIQLNAGDFITINPYQVDVNPQARALNGSATRNYFSVERIGN
jgi:hypothetical protein